MFCYYYHMKYEESPRQMLLRLKPGYKRFLDSKRGKDSLACQFDDICRTPFNVNVNNCFRATWSDVGLPILVNASNLLFSEESLDKRALINVTYSKN